MLKRLQYSESFNHLIGNKDKLTKLLNGCCFFSSSFELWCHSRRFIASVIDKDGTILDIGCANGFLLRCFQEWSGHLLTPYGLDLNESFIDQAKWLFPQHREHFLQFDILKLPETNSFTLPRSYDFVYWAIWDDWTFKRPLEIQVIRSIAQMVKAGGKLILGLYHEDRRETLAAKVWSDEKLILVLDEFLSRHPTYVVFVLDQFERPLDAGKQGARVKQLTDDRSISAYYAVVANADLFLGVDSCFLHAADLFRVPGVGLFGPTNHRVYGFRVGPHRHVCANGPMDNIHESQVLEALEEIAPA